MPKGQRIHIAEFYTSYTVPVYVQMYSQSINSPVNKCIRHKLISIIGSLMHVFYSFLAVSLYHSHLRPVHLHLYDYRN